MQKLSPIKRDPRLIWLSRDHHEGLLVVWKIRQGLRQGIEVRRIVAYLLHAVENELEPHFKEEEVLLFGKLDTQDTLRVSAETDHALIRERIKQISSSVGDTVDLLEEFAATLQAHIRFEERILYPHLEKVLPMETLDAVGRQLEAGHGNTSRLHWPDAFWIKGK